MNGRFVSLHCLATLLLAGCGGSSKQTEPERPSYVGSPTTLDAIPTHSAASATDLSEESSQAPFFMSSVTLRVDDVLKSELKTKGRVAQERLSVSFRSGRLSPETHARFPTVTSGPNDHEWTISEFREVSQKAVKAVPEMPTFVLDYDQPSMQKLLAEVPNDKRTREGLEAFVAKAIVHKTYARGFDIASRVAALRSGDCTEHAVLLAALMRANQIPARVVFGVVVALGPETEFAAGHAWVEAANQGKWRRFDAALFGAAESGDLAKEQIGIPGLDSSMNDLTWLYITTDVLDDESPAFSRRLASRALSGLISSVTLTLIER